MRHQVSKIGKLAELRAQTDRQLATLITNRLNRGFALAERLEGDEEIVRLVSEVRRLLPAVSRVDRVRLQAQLAQLEDALTFGMSMQAAS